MSDETKAALDNAIAAHINDVAGDAIVSGYVLQTSYFSNDTVNHGTTGYYTEVADDQPWHIGKGCAKSSNSTTKTCSTTAATTKMTDLLTTITACTITALLGIGATGLLLLHTWLRTIERTEHEDKND
ncbi:hypothetical protein GCM10009651_36500 [Microbacterium natoriense]